MYYIGKYFETHPENPDVPECIVYAEALAYMLENLPLDFPEDQLFFGGIEQFCFKELPPEITGEEYQKYVQIAIDRGMRWFSVGWDHAAPDYNTLMERGLGDFIDRAEKA